MLKNDGRSWTGIFDTNMCGVTGVVYGARERLIEAYFVSFMFMAPEIKSSFSHSS